MALLSAYAYDPSGINPLNKIVNERHSVQPPAEITDASLFFLRAAPAFSESIIVRDGPSATANVLVEGKDYILTTQYLWKSFELNKMIYGSISMINRNYSGDVYVDYQTLGGDFIVNDSEYLESLSKEIYKTRYIYWEQVVQNIPGLPAYDHTMSGTDTVGWGAVVDAILRLAAAIIDTSGGGGGGGGSDAALQQHINSSTAHRLASVGGSNLFNFALANDADFDNASVNRYTNPAVIVVWIRKYITSLGLGSAPQDIQQLQLRVNQIDLLIQNIQTNQGTFQSTLDQMALDFDDLKDRQDSVETSVANVAAEIPGIKDDITELREKIDGDPATGLEARMNAVETQSSGNNASIALIDDQLVDIKADIEDLKTNSSAPFDPTDILARLTTLEDQMVDVTDDLDVLKKANDIVTNGYDVSVPSFVLTNDRTIVLKPAQYVNVHLVGGGFISTDPLQPSSYVNYSLVKIDLLQPSGSIVPVYSIMTGSGVDGNTFSEAKQHLSNASVTDVIATASVIATDENGAAGIALQDTLTYGAGQTVESPNTGGSSALHTTLRYTNDSAVNVKLHFTVKQYMPYIAADNQPGNAAIGVVIVTP